MRLSIAKRVIGGVKPFLLWQRPEVAGFMLAWHLTNEEFLQAEPSFLPRIGRANLDLIRASRGLPPG